jgi:hypothetical protein
VSCLPVVGCSSFYLTVYSTNTHVPSPYWACVAPDRIPLSSCNQAADRLIEWFGPEELKFVVGGERWWQVRGLDGIDGEWITEKEFLSPVQPETTEGGSKLTHDQVNILKMEQLETVMVRHLEIMARSQC